MCLQPMSHSHFLTDCYYTYRLTLPFPLAIYYSARCISKPGVDLSAMYDAVEWRWYDLLVVERKGCGNGEEEILQGPFLKG